MGSLPKKISLPSYGADRQTRRLIKERSGVIAFRMGELQGKDVWHIIAQPYETEADHLMVYGKKPSGATIVRGPESAPKTAQLLYGKTVSRRILMDIGIVDATLAPISGRKGIKLTFTPDPLQKTTGDITLGHNVSIDGNRKVFPLRKTQGKG